jgi:uncharacterized protein YecE (DUF72 family)
VGVSGFAYEEWRSGFYPEGLPASRFLEHYSGRLPAVELNHTFHRFPAPSLVARWLRVTPPSFRFCLKVQRSISHSAAAFPKEEAAASFAAAVAPLGDRLGPFLLDVPRAFKPDPGRLDAILAALDRPAAVEFRDEGWLADPVFKVLERRGCVAASVDEEGMTTTERRTAGFSYYRLRRGEVDSWPPRLDAARAAGDVYAFVRHAPEAPALAARLLELAGTAAG